MGKWIALLEVETLQAPSRATDKTPETQERQVVGVLGVGQGGCANSAGPGIEPEAFEERAAIMEFEAGMTRADAEAAAAECLAPLVDPGQARRHARRDRLLRWGWPAADATALVERLARRDAEQDERVNCTDCCHYRPGRCGNHGAAMLTTAEVSRDLAGLLQRCPGFEP